MQVIENQNRGALEFSHFLSAYKTEQLYILTKTIREKRNIKIKPQTDIILIKYTLPDCCSAQRAQIPKLPSSSIVKFHIQHSSQLSFWTEGV